MVHFIVFDFVNFSISGPFITGKILDRYNVYFSHLWYLQYVHTNTENKYMNDTE